MSTIITSSLSTQVFNELVHYMRDCLEDSLSRVISDESSIEWYKTCSFEEYFNQFQEIWDGDVHVGDGLDIISHKIVLNDDTHAAFVLAFAAARADLDDLTNS